MNIVFLNLNKSKEDKLPFGGRMQFGQPTYYFDDVRHIIQFNYLTNGFCLLFICCENPGPDDFETIPLLKEYLPDSRLVMVSQNDDYEWVRGAFLAGADDYLVTHDTVEMEEYAHRMSADSSDYDPRLEGGKLDKLDKLWETNYLLRERLLAGLIDKSSANERNCNKWIRELHFNDYAGFIIFVLKLDPTLETADLGKYGEFIEIHNEILYQYLDELSNSSLTADCIVLLKQSDCVLALCCWGNEGEPTQKYRLNMTRFFENALHRFSEHTGFTCTMGVSNMYNDVRLTREAYGQAKRALSQRFYGGGQQLYFYSYRNVSDGAEVFDVAKAEEELEEALSRRSMDMLLHQCETVCEELKTYRLGCDAVRVYLVSIYNKILFSAGRYGFGVLYDSDGAVGIMERLQRLATFDQYATYIQDYLRRHLTEEAVGQCRLSVAVENAKRIIDEQYSEDLNLRSVAMQVHLNANYFSELFKKEIGMNFIDYLTKKRIAEAKKRLVRSNKSIYQIGAEVGYSEPVSFNRIFKKKCGITPSQYRKLTE